MQIKGILTERHFKPFASYQIVSEWENQISTDMDIPIYKVKRYYWFFFRNINRIKLSGLFLKLDSFRPVKNYYLYFSMQAYPFLSFPCIKNIIPIIIDFWLQKSELENFYKNYINCSLILITSKEVYEFLKENKCPLNIDHYPLSIPDEYVSNDLVNYEKTFDFLFAGRKDPIFWDYIKTYEKEYSNIDIEYIYKEYEDNENYSYISNKRGKLTQNYNTRELYKKLLKSAKITFYTTPGIDPAKFGANGFNQVTPRFLELISSGCLVMGRYPNNADVNFYGLDKICPCVNSYEEFKRIVNLFTDSEYVKTHKSMYYPYLIIHSTSSRLAQLKIILKKLFVSKNKY